MPEGGTIPTTHLGRVNTVEISGGEEGFEMYLGMLDGSRFVVNVHTVLGAIMEESTRELTAYLAEADDARATRPVPDDADAYDINDPKHPGWSVGV